MNKNIKDLAFEAGFVSAGFSQGEPVLANEKVILQFAKLIIDECCFVTDLGDSHKATEMIKNHFGIK
jgi:hypothetical protein